jgi:SAM-dependent methyltransferase
MKTRDEALNYPTGDLELGVCPACGFIANARFDPGFRDYNPRYEETQGFSERFNAFLVGLVKRLIDRYGIRGKRILEIGCGKGDFLGLLCCLGENEGVGIDPACAPERIPANVADRLTLIPDYYCERYRDLTGDVICCRHTLEHIPQTGEFLRGLREAIGDRRDVLVFFEVPDTLRVLREGAFWDIYYEHCSYFTPGSLARLFRASGFQIEELYLDYGDQYIMITARPADHPTGPYLEIENDLDLIPETITSFRGQVPGSIETWRDFVSGRAKSDGRIVLWGSSSKAVAFLTTLGCTSEIECVVDINPYRWGKFMPGTGQRIIAPRELTDYNPDFVLVMNPIYRGEVQRDLKGMGLNPKLLTV